MHTLRLTSAVVALFERLVPGRLGPSFRWLLATSWVSNLSDGMALAAGPLLVADQTDDAFLIAMSLVAQRLPWLVFGLPAGVAADRLDRRTLIVAANLVRAAVLGLLIATIITGTVGIGVVLVALFVLGTSETIADSAGGAVLPMVVPVADLGLANARLVFGNMSINQLVGPPVGAALFAAGVTSPFVAQMVLLTSAALLASRIVLPSRDGATDARRSIRNDIGAGLRWLWRHAPMRTLALTILAFNVTFGAAWSVLVILARQRLGLGPVGFGLLTASSAVGGVLGAVLYRALEQRYSLATLMRAGLVVEALTHLSLAVTRSAWVAMLTLFTFGIHSAVWATTSTSVRQRAVPDAFQGRVGSVYLVGLHGGLVVGGGVGGVVASAFGVTGPFWFGFVGSVLILIFVWRQLGHIVQARPGHNLIVLIPRCGSEVPDDFTPRSLSESVV